MSKSLDARPHKMEGPTIKYESGCGSLYVTVNGESGNPYEVFIYNKSGCTGLTEGLARTVSLYLRNGGDPDKLFDQLNTVRCYRTYGAPKINCAKAVAMALKEYIENHKPQVEDKNDTDEVDEDA